MFYIMEGGFIIIPLLEYFVSQNTTMNYFPTQKSKVFGIPFRINHSIYRKRKIRNEYKTKKTTFQKDTSYFCGVRIANLSEVKKLQLPKFFFRNASIAS